MALRHSPLRDVDACRAALRTWAWQGAKNHPVSGVGQWEDDIPTKDAQLSPAGQVAVDHIAAPQGGPDFDTDQTRRRFVHRSIREHLVAEHVASLPAEQAVQELLPHLWYDPDWEHTAPAAIAMHPEHDQLLQELIHRAAQSDQIPEDLSVIDAGWEFRRFLARVAAESSEADWSPKVGRMIGQARVELARAGNIGDLGVVTHWQISNRQAREAILEMLISHTDGEMAGQLVRGVVLLATTAEDKRQAREALLALLTGAQRTGRTPRLHMGIPVLEWGTLVAATTGDAGGLVDAQLVRGVVQLATTAEDKRQAREALLALLTRETWGPLASVLAGGVAQLDPAAEDKRQAREALLSPASRPNPRPANRRVGAHSGAARPRLGGQAPGPRSAARPASSPNRRLGGGQSGGTRDGPAQPRR